MSPVAEVEPMKWLLGTAFCLLCVWSVMVLARAESPDPSAPALSVELARREVRMLDDVYKTAVVLINDTFVEDGASAGDVAREIFAAIRKKGWHDARLLDATGKPMNKDNVPMNAFEKRAIEQILKGEAYYDEVVEEQGRKYLRAATVVPVVNAKCIACHPGHKVGDVLGAIGYKIPVRD
jgi:hypothetical protein